MNFIFFLEVFLQSSFSNVSNCLHLKIRDLKTKYWTFEPTTLNEKGHFEFSKRTQQPKLASTSNDQFSKYFLSLVKFCTFFIRPILFILRCFVRHVELSNQAPTLNSTWRTKHRNINKIGRIKNAQNFTKGKKYLEN